MTFSPLSLAPPLWFWISTLQASLSEAISGHGRSETVEPTTPACHDSAPHTFINEDIKDIAALLAAMFTPA